MVYVITLSNGESVTGAIQGYGGECRTIERVREYLTRLQRKRNPHDVYIKVGFDPVTGKHEPLHVQVRDIVNVEEI